MKENIVYKGSERRVIVVKSGSSKHFEEAHFFLKADDAAFPSMPDLLLEANRIVEHSLLPPVRQKQMERRRFFFRGFGIGFAVAGGISVALWIVSLLIGLY